VRVTHRRLAVLRYLTGVSSAVPDGQIFTEKEMLKKIDKHMTVTEILNIDPMISNILAAHGMTCLFCGAAVNESLEDACRVHGFDDDYVDIMVEQINDFIGSPENG